MINPHTTEFLGSLPWNGLADLSVCILSHSQVCVHDLMTLMRLHRCTFSSRPSLFVFVINTTFHELNCLLSSYMQNIWHILSVKAQTCLSVWVVLSEPLLLSHMCKLGVHMAYSFGQYSDETKYAWSLARAFTALIRAQNGRTYGIFHQSMLIGAWACVLSRKTCTKWAFIWHILSVKAQTCLSNCVVSSEPLLLSHMHKMGVHMAYFFSQCSDET